ncbi:MAG TPA: cytochrome c3 family protein [archaeon]|nr:cytochrome c3 family protein [archaeon]
MTLSKRVMIVMIIAILTLIVLFSAIDGWNYVTKNEFCEKCHGIEFEKYNTPGDSMDFAHNDYGISCSQCHEAAGTAGMLEFKKEIALMLIYDVAGIDAPPEEDEVVIIENRFRCLKCHSDYISLTSRRVINPHSEVGDCNSCHKGHERGISEQTCGKCHTKAIASLEFEGGKHAKKGCSFCHPQHGYVPKCQDCHGLYHPAGFEECAQCHTNAHAPRNLEFSSNISKEECTLCHFSIIRSTFEAQPTKHVGIECVLCHPKHGQIPVCTSCHTGHDETMKAEECTHCHLQGHVPSQVDYPPDTPASLCGGCHEENARHLKENITGHSDKNCAYCHPRHGQIPECTACHGSKHGMSSGCTTCHMEAHNLGFPKIV